MIGLLFVDYLFDFLCMGLVMGKYCIMCVENVMFVDVMFVGVNDWVLLGDYMFYFFDVGYGMCCVLLGYLLIVMLIGVESKGLVDMCLIEGGYGVVMLVLCYVDMYMLLYVVDGIVSVMFVGVVYIVLGGDVVNIFVGIIYVMYIDSGVVCWVVLSVGGNGVVLWDMVGSEMLVFSYLFDYDVEDYDWLCVVIGIDVVLVEDDWV